MHGLTRGARAMTCLVDLGARCQAKQGTYLGDGCAACDFAVGGVTTRGILGQYI